MAELDASAVRSLYEVRAVLEAQAARLFSERASNDEIRSLVEAVKAIEQTYKKGTTDSRLDAKNRFYDILIDGSRNEILSSMFRTINDRINLLRRMSMSSRERLPQSLAEIKALVDAIVKRNSTKAFELSLVHVNAASEAALRSIKQ